MKKNRLYITLIFLFCIIMQNRAFDYNGLTYRVISVAENTVAVAKGQTCQQDVVIIPETFSYKGRTLTVKRIDAQAFLGNDLKQVFIPKSITYIGEKAFSSSKLQSIEIEDGGLEEIGSNAFNSCQFTSIKLPSCLKIINYNAFAQCRKLQSIEVPPLVKKLDVGVFADCRALSTIKLPDNLELIDKNAFMNTHINPLVIPRGVKTVKAELYNRGTDIYIGDPSYPDAHNPQWYIEFEWCNEHRTEHPPFSKYISDLQNGHYYSTYIENMYIDIRVKNTNTSSLLDYPLKQISFGPNIKSVVESDLGVKFVNKKLKTIILYCYNPPICDSFPDDLYVDCTVYVPKGSLAYYQINPNWKNFWDIREFNPSTGINDILKDSDQEKEVIFDLNGRKLPALQKGWNIIKSNRKKTQKVYIK